MADVTLTATLTFHHISGDSLQADESISVNDFLLDAFAGEFGKQNGARKPLRLSVSDNHGHEATYELGLVD